MLKKLLPVMMVVFGALPVGATTAYYVGTTGETSFLAATGSLTFTSSFSIDGTGFIGTESGTGLQFQSFVNNNSGSTTLTITGGKLAQTTASNGSTLLVDIPVTAYALGMYVRTTSGSATYCIEAPGTSGCGQSAFVDSTANVFIGVISDAPITDFQLERTGGVSAPKLAIVSVADITAPLGSGGGGGGSETPEPSSMVLMGGALSAIPLLARWRRRK